MYTKNVGQQSMNYINIYIFLNKVTIETMKVFNK